MPYASNKQAAFMHIHHPDIAAKWHEEGHGYVKGGPNDPGKKKRRRIRKADRYGWWKPVAAGTVAGALANQIPPAQDVVRAERRRKERKKGKISKLLVPLSDDSFFNQDAAQKMFDLVMKMDDETAEMFCYIVASDLLEQEVENNQATLQKHLNEVIAKRVNDLKQATIRLVSKGMENPVPYAQALAMLDAQIHKADPIPNWEFERKIKRDPSTGRFQIKFSDRGLDRPMPDKTAKSMGIAGTSGKVYGALDAKDKARYQNQYLQVANFLDAVNAATDGNNKTLVHFVDDDTGETWAEEATSTKPMTTMMPKNVRAVGAEALPTSLTAGGAAFSLAGAMGHTMEAGTVQRMQAAGPKVEGWGTSWLQAGEGEPQNANARLYQRTKTLGEAAGTLGAPGGKVQLAGKMAEIVGQYGPQAEAVLGPSARKTAYRYRGTEKTPDQRLVRSYGDAIQEGKKIGPIDRFAELEEGRRRQARGAGRQPFGTETAVRPKGARQQKGPGPGPAPSLTQMVAEREARAGRAPEWQEREQGRKAVADYLTDKLPSKQHYKLQLASGNTPPSEGVIINSDGQIVTQAVGYGDDHYLPFNLKNLKGLKGGEYIRNRSVGGLTSEDVYTGLISGARRVTVVSRSGTFTMEFQPDFRGGRRHNDKARRMTRRYEQLLDAVQSEQVERQDVPVRWRKMIEDEVRGEYGPSASQRLVRAEIDARIKEFKENPQINGRDLDRAEAAISRMEEGEKRGVYSRQDVADYRKEVMNELRDLKEIHFRLNGVGYAAALESLREQFPYYIQTDSNPKEEHLEEFERDEGYVEPGRNRPTGASAGWFGTAEGKSGKFTAARADYQRGLPGAPAPRESRYRSGNRKEDETSSGSSSSVSSRGVSANRDRTRDRAADALEQVQAQSRVRDAAVQLQQAAKTHRPPGGTAPPVWWDYDRDQMAEYLEKPENLKGFRDFVTDLGDQWGDTNAARQYNQFVSAQSRSGGGAQYGPEHANHWQPTPYKFDPEKHGEAFRSSADPVAVTVALNRLDGDDIGLQSGKPLSQLNDKELREEFDLTKDMRAAMQSSKTYGDDAQDAFGSKFAHTGAFASRFFRDDAGAARHLENIHKTRALKAKGGPGGTGTAGGGTWRGLPGQPSGGGAAPRPEPPEPVGGGYFVPVEEEKLQAELAPETKRVHSQYRDAAQRLAQVAQQQGGQVAMDAYNDYARKVDMLPSDKGMDPFLDTHSRLREEHPQLHQQLERLIARTDKSAAQR
jgi:hypothetical protein